MKTGGKIDNTVMSVKRTKWDAGFPDTIINSDLGSATSHPKYKDAKAGDIVAAGDLVGDVINDKAVEALKVIAAGRPAILVPVFAVESSGDNMIPLAMAIELSKRTGLDWDSTIIQSTKVGRTGASGWYRIANSPEFDGHLDDDSPGAFALTGKQYSRQLRLSSETLTKLREKHADLERWWTEVFGYNFERLTEWEARYIVNSGKSSDQIRDIIFKEKEAAFIKYNGS